VPSQLEKLNIITPDMDKSIRSEMEESSSERRDEAKKMSDEEKIYNNLMDQYNLIDNINKNTNSIEYKFNFTFDKYNYAGKENAYIVRCIDNKNDVGQSSQESMVEQDSKVAKYKKEKVESIKPLFEIYLSEKAELLSLPENFPKISNENREFQKLLEKCKLIIYEMSKIHGQKRPKFSMMKIAHRHHNQDMIVV